MQGKQKAAGKKQSNTPWPAAGVAEGGGYSAFFEYILKYVSCIHNFFPAQRTTLKTPSTYLEHDHKVNRKIFRAF